jgi:outer membrane protein assembly factor BamB
MKMRFALLAAVCVLGASRAPAVDEIRGDARNLEQLPPITVAADDWPWWRGRDLNGIARPQDVPLTFSDTENVLWSIDIPGRGHASPTLWGERLFLATADDEKQEQFLLAYDRRTGKKLWQTLAHSGGFMKKSHRQNSHASATPACDGQRVLMPFIHDGGLWVTATDLDGNILWQTNAGLYDAIYGFGMSPAIWGSLVIVCGDNDQTGAFVAALHRKTGQIVWRVERPKIDTYGQPIVPRVAGRDQLLLGGGGYLMSYDPNTGDVLWKCAGPTTETTANTAAFSEDHVFVSGGYPKPYIMMSVRVDNLPLPLGEGRGEGAGVSRETAGSSPSAPGSAGGSTWQTAPDVTKTHLAWQVKQKMPYVPSPLYHDGLLYIADDWGFATCVDANTGRFVWSKRLGGDFTSSPVMCGNNIYAANEAGTVYVFKTGRTYELLAKNEMNDGIMSTPTIAGNRIYIRTLGKLYCIGAE